MKKTGDYSKIIVKKSKLLDEMAAKPRAEVLRIEANSLDVRCFCGAKQSCRTWCR